jgi:hypothetical protein
MCKYKERAIENEKMAGARAKTSRLYIDDGVLSVVDKVECSMREVKEVAMKCVRDNAINKYDVLLLINHYAKNASITIDFHPNKKFEKAVNTLMAKDLKELFETIKADILRL